MMTKTCGREARCDLVLEHSTISRVHARIELAEDGRVSLEDNGSSNGVFLNRNGTWIRAKKITLCIGDRVRLGGIEVPLEQLTAVFGHRSNARLEPRHFSPRDGNMVTGPFATQPDEEPLLLRPRRNPVTGKIEENSSN